MSDYLEHGKCGAHLRRTEIFSHFKGKLGAIFGYFERHFFLVLVILFALALSVRLLFVRYDLILREDPLTYLMKSLEITKGDFTPVLSHAMGWPLFMSPFLLFFGSASIFQNMAYAMVLSSFFGALCIFPLAYIGKELLDKKREVLFLLILFIFSFNLVIIDTSALAEPIFTLFFLTSVYFIIKTVENRNRIFLASLFAAFAHWVRPNGILILFIILSSLFLMRKHIPRFSFKYLLCAAVVFFVAAGPFLYQRYAHFGSPFFYGPASKYFVDSPEEVFAGNVPAPSLIDYLSTHSFSDYYHKFVERGLFRLIPTYIEVITPLLLPFFLYGVFRRFNDKKFLPLTMVFVIWIVFFIPVWDIFGGPKHLFPTIPFILVFSTVGLCETLKISKTLEDKFKKRAVKGAVKKIFDINRGFFPIVLLSYTILALGYSIWGIVHPVYLNYLLLAVFLSGLLLIFEAVVSGVFEIPRAFRKPKNKLKKSLKRLVKSSSILVGGVKKRIRAWRREGVKEPLKKVFNVNRGFFPVFLLSYIALMFGSALLGIWPPVYLSYLLFLVIFSGLLFIFEAVVFGLTGKARKVVKKIFDANSDLFPGLLISYVILVLAKGIWGVVHPVYLDYFLFLVILSGLLFIFEAVVFGLTGKTRKVVKKVFDVNRDLFPIFFISFIILVLIKGVWGIVHPGYLDYLSLAVIFSGVLLIFEAVASRTFKMPKRRFMNGRLKSIVLLAFLVVYVGPSLNVLTEHFSNDYPQRLSRDGLTWGKWVAQNIRGKIAITEGGDLIMVNLPDTKVGGVGQYERYAPESGLSIVRPGYFENLSSAMEWYKEIGVTHLAVEFLLGVGRMPRFFKEYPPPPYLKEVYSYVGLWKVGIFQIDWSEYESLTA